MENKLMTREEVEHYKNKSAGLTNCGPIRKLATACLSAMDEAERSNKAAWKCHEESMKAHEEAEKYRKALEAIADVNLFGREGGTIVTSEHYEAAWLDCLKIAKAALAGREGEGKK